MGSGSPSRDGREDSTGQARDGREGYATLVGDRVGAYATLVRVPNLFTAPPDVVVGASLGLAAGGSLALPALGALMIASVLLYAAGTTLNDYFDAPTDAVERPERPIPSGRVSPSAAGVLGAGLLAAGVAVAALGAEARAGAIAAVLALTIVLYDGLLKGGSVGALAMGATRGVNVWLGAVAAGGFLGGPAWPAAVPVVVVAYIAAVTVMANTEAEGGNRRAVLVALAGAMVAGLAVIAVAVLAGPPLVRALVAAGLGIAFVVWTGSTLLSAYWTPRPAVVGPAVGTCVLGLVVLDAAFAAATDLGLSLAALSFLVPAVGLSTVFDVS